MSDVERWNPTNVTEGGFVNEPMMALDPEGGYVDYDDYAALREENKRYKEALEESKKLIEYTDCNEVVRSIIEEALHKMKED